MIMYSTTFTVHLVKTWVGQGGPWPPLATMKLRQCAMHVGATSQIISYLPGAMAFMVFTSPFA
jgi:hypothetical protein